MSLSVHRGFVLVCLAACPASPDGTTDPQVTTGPSSSTGATSSGQPTTSGATAGTSGSTAEVGCGDGSVQAEEACDDGNKINGDGCNNDCSLSGVAVWTYQSLLDGHERLLGLALGEQDSIFVGGIQSAGGEEVDKWVARFTASGGAPVWWERYDHGPGEGTRGLAATADILYAVGGTVTGDDFDVWVAGLNLADGEVTWQDTYSSGLGPDYATAVVAIPGGDAVVAGLLTAESAEGGDLWVRRYAADGAQKWTATHPKFGFPLWQNGPGISSSAEHVVIGYVHRLSDEFTPETLIAFPHAGGPALWNVDISATSGIVFGVAHASDGDVVVASKGDYKEFVVRRLSGDGTAARWESNKCTGGDGRAVAIDSQGDIVAIGDGDGDGGNGPNIRLCKFSAEGSLRWAHDIDGGFGTDRGYAVAIASNDHIVVGGWITTGANSSDAWLAMYSP